MLDPVRQRECPGVWRDLSAPLHLTVHARELRHVAEDRRDLQRGPRLGTLAGVAPRSPHLASGPSRSRPTVRGEVATIASQVKARSLVPSSATAASAARRQRLTCAGVASSPSPVKESSRQPHGQAADLGTTP